MPPRMLRLRSPQILGIHRAVLWWTAFVRIWHVRIVKALRLVQLLVATMQLKSSDSALSRIPFSEGAEPSPMPSDCIRNYGWSRWQITSLTLALLATLGGAQLHGQAPLSQMYHRSWTVRDGAPNDIEDVVQGPDGFLWLTTGDGLYRFDGVSFTRYRPPDGAALLSDRLNAISIGRDGSIWLGYMLGGVTRIKGNELTNFTQKDGLRSGHIGKIAEDLDGRVWIAGTRGLQFIRDSHVTRFDDGSGVGDFAGEDIVVDKDGNVWSPHSHQSLMVLEHGTNRFIVASDDPYYGCSLAKDSGVWCRSATKPLMHFALSHSKVISQALVRPASTLYTVLGAKDGSVWMGTGENGIQRLLSPALSSSAIEFFDRKEGLTGDLVGTVIEDREGSTWVATDRGLDQFRPIPFHEIQLNDVHVTLSANRSRSNFFVATDRLIEMTSGQQKFLSPAMISTVARSLYQGDDGTVWMGTTAGLWRYVNGRAESVPLPEHLVGNFPAVQTIVESATHDIWASIASNGLYRLDQRGWIKRGGYVGLPDATALASFRDHHGDLWFGFQNSVLARVSAGQVTIFDSSNGLQIGDIRTLTERSGQLWIGGDRGVVVYDEKRFRQVQFSEQETLRGVTGLVFLPNGDLWINSSSGVLQVLLDRLGEWDQNPDHTLEARHFDYLDGIDGIPAAFAGNPSAAVSPDGKLFIATSAHLQWIDPLQVPVNQTPPQVWVTGIRTTHGEVNPVSASVRLVPDTRNVEISYTATSLQIPERVRFRYRLQGFDKDWVDAGTRRQAFYAKLPAGSYTFQAIACNDSGIWNSTGVSINLTVSPTFTETIWFKLGVFLTVTALIFLFFRMRLSQAKRRVADRLYDRFAERERIARDLHDTLLQSVQALIFKFAVATKKLPANDPVRPIFEATLAQSDQVLLEGRKLITDLHSGARPANALLESLQAIGEELHTLYPSTQFVVDAQGTERELNTVVSQELTTFGREALTNAFRHAEAAHVWLVLQYTPEELRLQVRDNGLGIDENVLSKGFRSGHWGLRNMKERARRLGGRFTSKSSSETGTTVEILISGPLVYADHYRGFPHRIRVLFARWF
jgi:signal transduction histidine kinase/ligand-binding sensor domain-containing protein